jgi:hypothetical protein
MRERNNYSSIPTSGDTNLPLKEWWTVEGDKGVALAGEDSRFDADSPEEAEQMAVNLACYTDAKLTVVRYTRTEEAAFQAERIVRKLEP